MNIKYLQCEQMMENAQIVWNMQSMFFSDFQDVGLIINSSLGLSGEVGELNDMIKKWIFHQKELDKVHVKKEIGDILWYIAGMCEAFGFSLDDVMQMNIDKLKARYPEGFDVVRANNRKEGDI